MKVVILAGGRGLRLVEGPSGLPKAMVKIGGFPIIWHIMKNFSAYGFHDFIVCAGHQGKYLQEFFSGLATEKWQVSVVDTGVDSSTAERIFQVQELLEGDSFFLAYCDGLTDCNLGNFVSFHKNHGKLVSVLAPRPRSTFGVLEMTGDSVSRFEEKPLFPDNQRINGGFFIVRKEIFKYFNHSPKSWERDCLVELAERGELKGMRHDGFWHSMNTRKDQIFLENLWIMGEAPWRNWKN
jgi:glucose-1-phosphate cytidylyltransferase